MIYLTVKNALKIHRAELTQAELTQGGVDSGADLTSGWVELLPPWPWDFYDETMEVKSTDYISELIQISGFWEAAKHII